MRFSAYPVLSCAAPIEVFLVSFSPPLAFACPPQPLHEASSSCSLLHPAIAVEVLVTVPWVDLKEAGREEPAAVMVVVMSWLPEEATPDEGSTLVDELSSLEVAIGEEICLSYSRGEGRKVLSKKQREKSERWTVVWEEYSHGRTCTRVVLAA